MPQLSSYCYRSEVANNFQTEEKIFGLEDWCDLILDSSWTDFNVTLRYYDSVDGKTKIVPADDHKLCRPCLRSALYPLATNVVSQSMTDDETEFYHDLMKVWTLWKQSQHVEQKSERKKAKGNVKFHVTLTDHGLDFSYQFPLSSVLTRMSGVDFAETLVESNLSSSSSSSSSPSSSSLPLAQQPTMKTYSTGGWVGHVLLSNDLH